MIYCIKGFRQVHQKIAPQNPFLSKHDFYLSKRVHSAYYALNPFWAIQLLRSHCFSEKVNKGKHGERGVVRSECSHFKRFQRHIIVAITCQLCMHNTDVKPQVRKCYQKSYIYEVCLYNCSHNMIVTHS